MKALGGGKVATLRSRPKSEECPEGVELCTVSSYASITWCEGPFEVVS